MNNNTEKIGSNTIKNIAYEVRSNNRKIVDQCFQISEGIQELFNQRYGIQIGIQELHIGEKRETHFVNTLPMNKYSNGVNNGNLLIDGSIQQFCISNKDQGRVNVGLDKIDNLPPTALYEPGCEERVVWYTKPNDTDLVGRLQL